MGNIDDEIRYYSKQIAEERENLMFFIDDKLTIRVILHPIYTIGKKVKLNRLDKIEEGFYSVLSKRRTINDSREILDYIENHPIVKR
ncbi:MAG: hypothetical protein IJ568_02085 [Bacilli bacterium]|nr:hypothetical protein [Bacilli bacterium]